MDNQQYLEGIIKLQQEQMNAQNEIINMLTDRLKLFGCDLSQKPNFISHDMFLSDRDGGGNG